MTRLVLVTSDAELAAVRRLFEEYAASLDLDLGFQDFASELAGLPGEYVPPLGALMLAVEDDLALGCVALRPLEPPRIAELKRLYVRPQARGQRLGARLSEAAVAFARGTGYEFIRLDTLSSMAAAQRLYETLGFRDIEAYRYNPAADARFMQLDLGSPAEQD